MFPNPKRRIFLKILLLQYSLSQQNLIVLKSTWKKPEFKHKKIEGSFDFLRFKTTLAKSEYYESSLQSNCPHLDTQNVGQILTFSENCHHEDTFILNKYFGVIDSVLQANIIFLMLSFPLHVCIYAYSVFGVILFAVPWASSFALHLTAIIYNNKIDRKIRSISNICFQPHVLVTGITPKFKKIIISITLLYIIELITITFNYIYSFTSKRQEINNDEALQEIAWIMLRLITIMDIYPTKFMTIICLDLWFYISGTARLVIFGTQTEYQRCQLKMCSCFKLHMLDPWYNS